MRLALTGLQGTAMPPPSSDRFDPAGDGGFAAALADASRTSRDMTAARQEARTIERRTAQPSAAPSELADRESDPSAAAAPGGMAAIAAAAVAEPDAASAEKMATEELGAAVAADDRRDAEPAEEKTAAHSKKKTDGTDTGTTADGAMTAAAPMHPPAPPPGETVAATGSDAGNTESAGNALLAAGLETQLLDGDATAGDAVSGDPTLAASAADDTPGAPFALELARQTAPAAAAKEAAPPPAAPHAAAPAEQVAVKLATAVNGKNDRIRIHLSPEMLGKVDVTLELGKDGQVQAVIRADKPETLHLLMHDAKQLVRGLQDAGFQANTANLQFGLSGDDAGRRPQSPYPAGPGRSASGDAAETEPAFKPLGRSIHGGIDLSI